MKRLAASILVGVLACGAAACATTSTVVSAPVTAGTSMAYTQSYEAVKVAAVGAVHAMDVTVSGRDETAERFQIRFEKSVSAFSWGEVGVVNVVRAGDGATVYVNSEKRSQMQITGTSEKQFAEKIFASISQTLAAGS